MLLLDCFLGTGQFRMCYSLEGKHGNDVLYLLGGYGMRKFEYKALSIKKGTFTSGEKYASQFTTELNALGMEGWELIEITGNATLEGFVLMVFKRELSQ